MASATYMSNFVSMTYIAEDAEANVSNRPNNVCLR